MLVFFPSLRERYRAWRFKNTTFLVLSLVAFFLLAETPFVDQLIRNIGELGYLGALLTGIFFVSTFTVAPASVVLFHLAQNLNPFGVAFVAGAGAMAGDFLIFRFFEDKVFDELRPMFLWFGGDRLRAVFSTPYFSWLVPVIGAAIIASPFPDEVGIGLMGLSNIRRWHFLLLTFLLNSLGILLIVTLAQSV